MTFARVSLAAIAAMLAAATGTAEAETLREALAAAYSSNPDLLAARAQQRSVDENVPSAVSNWRPTITGQANVNWFDSENQFFALEDGFVEGPTGPVPVEAGDLLQESFLDGRREQYSANLDQPLFRGFRNFNEFRRAKAQVFAGRAQLLSTEQQVLLDSVTAFVNVLRDEAVLRLNENNVQVLTRQLEASQDRFRVGEITRTDVAQSEARLAGADAARIAAQADLEASRAAYRRVIGDYPGTLEEAPPLPPLPESEDAALDIASAENPLVVAARYSERVAQYAVKTSEGALLPTITANAQWSRFEGPQNFGAFDGGAVSTTRQAGVRMTVPLYQSGAEWADIRRNKQVRSQRMLEIVSAERQVIADVRTAWERYLAAQSSIESTGSAVRANEIALDGVRQEAAVGSRTTLDVLDAEQELLDARVNLVRARRDEYVAGFTLLASLGRLNAKSLDLPVQLYDPADYYREVKWKFIGWGTDYED